MQSVNARGFSLVEMLVVIAIVSVLAAMLLPTVEQAMEASRRMACAGNQKQWYVAASMRAEDNRDALPPAAFNIRMYGRTLADPFVMYLRDYLGVPVTQPGFTAVTGDYRNAAFCPSMQLVFTSGDWHWDHHIGYMTPAFSMFDATNFGYARLGAMAGGGTGVTGARAPIAIIQDPVVLVPPGAWGSVTWMTQYANNHQQRGGNVTSAAGSVKWVDASNWYTTYAYFAFPSNGMVPFAHPMGYFSQDGQRDATPTSVSYGLLPVFYPDEQRERGLHHQPTEWAPNRRMFGYR